MKKLFVSMVAIILLVGTMLPLDIAQGSSSTDTTVPAAATDLGDPITVEHAMPCKWYSEEYRLINVDVADAVAKVHVTNLLSEEAGTVNGQVYYGATSSYAPGSPVGPGVASSEAELVAEEGGQVGQITVTGLGVDAGDDNGPADMVLSKHVDIKIWFDKDGDGVFEEADSELIVQGKLFDIACQWWELGVIPGAQAVDPDFEYTIDGGPLELPLMAGQNWPAGTVTVWNDATNLYVEYDTTDSGWEMAVTHVYVGAVPPAIPSPATFPYKEDPVQPPLTESSYVIPLLPDWNGLVYIAAHAEGTDGETGWGSGGSRRFKVELHVEQIEDPLGTRDYDDDGDIDNDDAQKRWWPTNALQGDRCTFDMEFSLIRDGFADTETITDNVIQLWPAELPELLVSWSCLPQANMGDNYDITLTVTNPSENMQTLTFALVETTLTPDPGSLDWELDDQRQWWFESEPYNGENIQREVAPGETLELTFTVNHHWNWIPPWDLTRFLHIAGIIVGALPGLELLSLTKTTIDTLLTYEDSVLESVYSYQGIANSESTWFQTTLSVPWYKQLSYGESVISGIAGGKMTALGLLALLTGIGAPAAPVLFAGEAVMIILGEVAYALAVDPQDDYTTIVVPEPLAMEDLCPIEDPTGAEIAQQFLDLFAFVDSMKDAYIRYDIAEDMGDLEWMAVQFGLVQRYASEAERIMSELATLLGPLVEGVPVPTEAEMEEIRQSVAEIGLPEFEECVLAALGYSQEEIDQVEDAVENFPDNYFVYSVDICDTLGTIGEALDNFSSTLPPLPEGTLAATIDVKPDVLDVESEERYITVYIELPEGYDVANIDCSSVRLQESVQAESCGQPLESLIGDYDEDGILDMLVEFDREVVFGLIDAGHEGLAVTGQLFSGTVFGGADAIRVRPVAHANGPYDSYEGSPRVFDASGSYDPDGSLALYEWDFDDDEIYDFSSSSPWVDYVYGDDYSGNATLRITDDDGLTSVDTGNVTVTNVAPTVVNITAPLDPVPVNTLINTDGNFTDPGFLDTHSAVWDWGDGNITAGIVTETNGSGNVTGSHAYDTPGVYTVKLTVEDDDGGVESAEYQYVVVYDPSGGFVTGGGWIHSEAGAYVPDNSLEGKATFGFVSKYKQGATTPTGQTEFQFKVADLNFHSDSYDWLVIAGHRAMYKGVGTINGEGNYGFMLSAIDEALTPSTDVDLFRIKIWDKDDDDTIVYDNQMEAADDATPATEIGGGSIVIHKAK